MAITGLIGRLWAGEVPLARAFWVFAVLYGFVLNLLATLGYLAVLANDGPAALAYLVYFLPLPYDIFMLVAVWRSAARYRGPSLWADLARAGVIVWTIVEVVA